MIKWLVRDKADGASMKGEFMRSFGSEKAFKMNSLCYLIIFMWLLVDDLCYTNTGGVDWGELCRKAVEQHFLLCMWARDDQPKWMNISKINVKQSYSQWNCCQYIISIINLYIRFLFTLDAWKKYDRLTLLQCNYQFTDSIFNRIHCEISAGEREWKISYGEKMVKWSGRVNPHCLQYHLLIRRADCIREKRNGYYSKK